MYFFQASPALSAALVQLVLLQFLFHAQNRYCPLYTTPLHVSLNGPIFPSSSFSAPTAPYYFLHHSRLPLLSLAVCFSWRLTRAEELSQFLSDCIPPEVDPQSRDAEYEEEDETAGGTHTVASRRTLPQAAACLLTRLEKVMLLYNDIPRTRGWTWYHIG